MACYRQGEHDKTALLPTRKMSGDMEYDLSVDRDGIVRERDAADGIITGHGSACAKIIAKYAANAEFCSLRTFHRGN